jgi:hypothetical protein
VPSVQATVSDKFIYQLHPGFGLPHLVGRLDAFLRPLPQAADASPDRARSARSARPAGATAISGMPPTNRSRRRATRRAAC